MGILGRAGAGHGHRCFVGGGVLEVRRHEVLRDPPPAETFDLVHARLLLVHLKDRAAALRVLIDALRPDG